jgi:hypothetical protein
MATKSGETKERVTPGAEKAVLTPSAHRSTPARRKRAGRTGLLWKRLRDPRTQLPILLVLTILALIFTWQVRQPFMLDVGGPDDEPYLRGVHEIETAAVNPDGTPLTYRWTEGDATITIPGYGAANAMLTLRMQGARPNGGPPPTVYVTIGDSPQPPLALAPEMRDYTFPVSPGDFQDGGLRVIIDSPTFRPPGDARDLGIPLDRVELRDAGAAGLIMPPLDTLAVTLLAMLAAYAAVAILLTSPLGGALAGAATAALFVACALGPRFILTIYAPGLAWIIGATAATTLLTGWLAWQLAARFDWAATRRALGGASLIAGANLLVLLVGMRHPQFRSSDLQLNVHRLEFVQRGEWVFTLPLPGTRAIEAPYPPLFYAVMLPIANLVHDKALLVETTAAVALAAGALLTFALARRITGDDGAALWAAGCYGVLPIVFAMTSAGNFANLFGQGVANFALIALILAWGRWDRPLVATGLTIALTLALLGHFGVFLSLLATVPLLAIVASIIRPDGRRQALALAGCFVAALVISYALYYHFHTSLLLGHVRDFLSGDTDARGTEDSASFSQRLSNLWGGLLLWWGWPALPLALAGVNLLRRLRPSPQLWLALAWLGTAIPFALAELVAGLSVRFHLFVGPALALVAGWALWQLWCSHRRFGPVASLLIGGFWLWQALSLWSDRVLHAYH